MKRGKKVWSLLLSLCLLVTFMPQIAKAETGQTLVLSFEMTGNTGAVITATTGQIAGVTVDQPDIADAVVSDNQITVTGVSGAVGIVTLTVTDQQAATSQVQVPIGYTTFDFQGDQVEVYEGKDTEYSVTSYGSATEVTPVSTTAEDGGILYSNTEAQKISVGIKKKGGTYVFTGSSSDMSIEVKKEATKPAVLLLAGLDLTSTYTSPLTVKKDSASTVTVTALAGTVNTLSDAALNNADLYGTDGDSSNAEYAESAVIKAKTKAQVTLNGTGTLNLNCLTKNALKVGEYGSLTIQDLTLNITSAGHGISSDNTLNILSGNLTIDAQEDGIRSDPDAVDATLGCAGTVEIAGGTIGIAAGADAIQAAQDVTISGGSFDIQTGKGYQDNTFNSNTMSCKGIKASNNSTDTSTSTNTIEISGGDFKINTADDAIHSDAYVVISGGNFQIDTGDDGVHGDTSLTLGVENGQGPQIVIENSYEGLEAGNVYIYEGTYKVNTSDDGINAAGDSSQGNFNQGGGPGRPGGSGWGTSTSTASYSINIYGGDVYVNANGDGLDSNGNLNLYGGNIVVWGAPAQRDDEPLDCDGTLTIQGATVFGAGSSSMTTTPGSNSQAYVRYTNSGNGGGRPGQSSTSTIAEGKTINVKYNNETVYNVKAIKNVNYVIYSSPEMTSSSGWSITADDSALINPTETPTPDEQEPTATPTPDEQEPTVTPTPDEQEPTVTPTPDDQEPTVTPTPDEQEPTVTPTPDDQEPTVTPTPDGQEPTETPTPGQEEPTVTPTPDQEEPTVAPGQVKGLTATSAVTKVTLKWNKVSDADSYEVLRLSSQTGKYETIATTKKTTYTNTKLTAATAYAYKVRAVKNKTTGKASAIVKVLTKPEKVSGLSLKKKSNTKATIKLNQVSGATYYEIYRKNSSTKKYEIAYKIQGKKLYRYISSTGKYKKIGTVSVSKKGVITGTLTGLNLKAEKNQLYKVKAVKTKSGYTSVSGAFSSAVKVK